MVPTGLLISTLLLLNDKLIDVASRAKMLGVNISSDLKRNHHIVGVVQRDVGNSCFVFLNSSAQV